MSLHYLFYVYHYCAIMSLLLMARAFNFQTQRLYKLVPALCSKDASHWVISFMLLIMHLLQAMMSWCADR